MLNAVPWQPIRRPLCYHKLLKVMDCPLLNVIVKSTLDMSRTTPPEGRLRKFCSRIATVVPAFTVRTLPNFLTGLRNDGQNNWDLSVLKSTSIIRERVRTQFRFEMFNALNRVQFGNPTISPTSSTNGAIFAQSNTPRELQFGLKLIF